MDRRFQRLIAWVLIPCAILIGIITALAVLIVPDPVDFLQQALLGSLLGVAVGWGYFLAHLLIRKIEKEEEVDT